MPVLAELPSQTRVAETATRKHPRSLFSVPFQLRHVGRRGLDPIHAISLDISEGGLGALVQGHVRVGEPVQIDLPLGKQQLSAMAIVRHTSNIRSGFEFLGLTSGEREQITKVVGIA